MTTLLFNQAINQALIQEMERDERVIVFGEDVARHGGVFHFTRGLLDRFGSERVFDTPISESAIVGLAVGASMMGMRPVAEIQFTDLTAVAMDQIANSAAKIRFAHNGLMNAPLVIRTLTWGQGHIYSSQAWEAWFTHIPGLKVVMPSNPLDAKGLLIAAIRDPDPVIFLEHKSLLRMRADVPEELYATPLGEAAVVRKGTDVTIVAWGNMVVEAEHSAEELEEEGISVEIVDPRSLVPFDLDTVVESVCKTGRLVVTHEAVRRSGFGGEVAAAVMESEAFSYLLAPILRVANPGVPVPHSIRLRELALPDKDDITAAVRRVMAYE
jgi:pyruvate dehydrogenase E1 component beta subunit